MSISFFAWRLIVNRLNICAFINNQFKKQFIQFLRDPFLQLPGQLHGWCQGRGHAWLPSQWPTNHRATKKMFCTHTGDMPACEETPSGLNASYGGGWGNGWSHHRSRTHWSPVPGVSVFVCVCLCECVYTVIWCVHIFFFTPPLCCVRISKLHLPTAPPPLNEGESLVSRILQLGPPGTKFLGYGCG